MTASLDKIFKPKSIAVVGASETVGSAGYRIFRNLIGSGYDGVVYPVNPKRESVQGVQAYASINEVPKVVDLAIICTPAGVVCDVVEQCGIRGVKGILIISAGFKEIGPEGVAREHKLLELKKKYGLRIVGPNCVGFIMPYLNLNATFAGSMPERGSIALVSQSGAVCGAILDWAAAAKVGFSSFVSVGSMLDVDFGDLIDYFGMDMHTRSIVLYIESITDARKFMSATKGFARAKPIIVIKSGRYKEGAKAASSHTGALAGEDVIYDAAFRRSGVVRVMDIMDLFNCASILAKQPRPMGPNIAIVTNAGGPGVLATDSIVEKGGKLAPLSEETIKELNKVLPSHWSHANPVDIIGDGDDVRYQQAIEICLKDQNIDGLLVLCVPQVMADPQKLADKLVDIARKTTKPILTSFIGEASVYQARELLNRNNIPTYASPDEAVESYMYLYHYERHLEQLYETPDELMIRTPAHQEIVEKILSAAQAEQRTLLNESEAKTFLELYGITTTTPVIAKTADEAVKAAEKLGYPVVMKILSPQISHKSDVGGVVLDLRCGGDVKTTFTEMTKRAKEKVPQATIIGVTIQKQVKNHGYELILGSKKDPVFGSVILFGLGGIYTELFKDRAIGFPPLNQTLAQRIIEKTKAYQLLKGFRSILPVDMKKLEETMITFSQMLIDHPEIKEVDINPLIPQGNELIAVDARIILDPEPQKHPHLIITPYPTKYMKQITLKDNTSILLRPIKPEDENMWLEMFQSFSEETVRFRFFRIIKDTPHEVRTRYCNIDYDREIGIVAEVQDHGKKRILGVARLIVDPVRKDECEFALVVTDEWQRQGLGSEFLDYLIEIGQDKNLSKINGVVLKDNYPMIALCKEKGFQFSDGDPGEYKVEYDLLYDEGLKEGTLESGKNITETDEKKKGKSSKKKPKKPVETLRL
ncbi:MAG: bifunctional acetate--CoA ligase family protein/GNAT family N-acetyltransferase [Candidatus Thermoplasmatota archaeon]|nr:bifunctional acetate--CoA ligase family protein/GNAT family N-acetyltransferase [Candidatus Thermoplasmatota archaeon]